MWQGRDRTGWLQPWLLAGAAALVHSCGGAPQQPREYVAERPPSQQPLAARPGTVLAPWAVAEIQRALQERGFQLDVNKQYDEQTEDALRHFQEKQELAATGMPDLATLRHLELDPLPIYRTTFER